MNPRMAMFTHQSEERHREFSSLGLVITLWVGLLVRPACGQGDSYLKLSAGGDAVLPSAGAVDLDYTKDFSAEAVVMIEPSRRGGRWAFLIAKAGRGGSYMETSPGFAVGTKQGHQETFGQALVAKVGDGTSQAMVTGLEREGYAYAILTWEVATCTVILYVNGQVEGQASNSKIDPNQIKNSESLGLGQSGGYGALGRDIQFARLWNRKLSADEVQSLWSSFNSTKCHTLPTGISRTALVSEWLMAETCDSRGHAGTAYVKDTAGSNHLLMEGPAAVVIGDGALIAVSPVQQAVQVHKSASLTLQGGKTSLSSPITLPLQYCFELDESSQFDSAALRQSGWIAHYGLWSPILKPNTLYYWRAKVRDSSTPARESAFLPVRTFTTEGPQTWYVRPRDTSRTYGRQDGTSYDNAFNGLAAWNEDVGPIPGVIWGSDGVEAGDTLYVCGRHVLDFNAVTITDASYIYVNANGYSDDYPITLRGDEAHGSGTIVGSDQGYSLKIDRKKYVVFKNIVFEGFNLLTETITQGGDTEVITDIPRSTHIVFDGCALSGAQCLVTLRTGHDYWAFRNNSMLNGGVGIKTILDGVGPQFLTVEYNTIKHMGLPPFGDPDGHAMGLGAGEGYLIQGNYIQDTGTAIEFWTSAGLMRNMIVRDNFIKDIKRKSVTEGHGIAISGVNNDSFGLRTGFQVYGNIIVNTEGAGISSNNKDLVEIYNNVIYSCDIGIRFAVSDAPLAAAVFNNIVVSPRTSFILAVADPNVPWPNVSWNNNLYWPVPGSAATFDTIRASNASYADYRKALGWDADSLTADPRFVSSSPQEPADFRLESTSPATDAGEDVGITEDYAGNPVPQGKSPDIGAYEYAGVSDTGTQAVTPAQDVLKISKTSLLKKSR